MIGVGRGKQYAHCVLMNGSSDWLTSSIIVR